MAHQLTVDKTYKEEFNSLVHHIVAEFEQLDSGEFRKLVPQHSMLNLKN